VPDRLERVVATLTGTGSIDTYAVDVPQIADALEEVGRSGPLAVFIDDYHWTPPEGVELLIAALRVLETQVCLVASARLHGLGEEAAAPLPEPSADLWVDHLEVRGLEPSAVASLAQAVLGAEALPSLVDALYSRTFGNPLYIVETLQGWRTAGALVFTGGFWGIDTDAAPGQPRSLMEMITAHLARVDADALSVARSLAAIGRDADFDELSAIGHVGPSRLVEVIDRLIDEGLVALDTHPSPRYRLAHPLYGAALLDDEGTSGRSLLHGRIFGELRRRGDAGRTTSAAELAHHAVRALTRPPDLWDVLTAAAEEAEAAGSYEEAAAWYGHLAEAADDPRALARALRGQATAAINTDPHRAIGLFTYALGFESEAESRARLLLGRARAYRVTGTPELAFADLDQALPLAARDEAFDIRHAIGAFNGMLRRLDEAERIFRSLAQESVNTSNHSKAVGHLGMVALIRGSIAEGARLMEAALATCTDDEYAGYLRGNLAWLFGLLGRWEEAESMIEQTLAIAVASGDIYTECSMSGIGGRFAAWRGDLAKAFDRATRGHRLALRLGNPADVIATSDALASALTENEMHDQAAAILAQALAMDAPDTEEREMSYSFAVFARACLLAGDIARARIALDHARTHLPGAPFWAVAIDRCEAQIDLACDAPEQALGRLRPWLERPTEIVLEQAHVCDVSAQALFALGDRHGAEARASEALGIYQRLGAKRTAERMSSWIDAMRTPRKGRPRSSLPGRLTARESEILRLVVLGRSNQGVADELVISLGTVKKHLENIMAKAGVSRRTELVSFAISVGVLVAEELVLEREAVRERAAGSLMPRPARTYPPVAPRSVRPARGEQADPQPLERPGK
jgi:DNA-binding CsgD family transcriptional regulator